MEMTRAEHLAWAKQRALECLDRGDWSNAVNSMLSDLGKHDELQRSVAMGTMILMTIDVHNRQAVRRWITGFN